MAYEDEQPTETIAAEKVIDTHCESDCLFIQGVMECQFSTFTTSNMIRKDPIFKTLMLSRKGTVSERSVDVSDPLRFAGDGVTFRAKLIGVLEVNSPRGDRLCQEALGELKMAIKAAGEHKQRIMICISLEGLRLRDERTGDCLYHHAVHKISFIAQDIADPRAFGYIFGSPDQGHRFFGIKTDKQANLVVVAMRDLFQVVYDLKKKDSEKNKYASDGSSSGAVNKINGASHCLTGSVDSLDQMLALGSHLGGGCSSVRIMEGGSAIQTADLLNLHADEKPSGSFDPFVNSPFTSLTRKPSMPLSVAPSIPPPPGSHVHGAHNNLVPSHSSTVLPATPAPASAVVTSSLQAQQLKSAFSENFSDSFVSASPPHVSPLVPPPTKSSKAKATSAGISHYSTIRPRKKSANNDGESVPPQSAEHEALSALSSVPASSSSSTKYPSMQVRIKAVPINLTAPSAASARPTSANSNASVSPRPTFADTFDSQPFSTNFNFVEGSATAAANAPPTATVSAPLGQADRLDLFTDLDPLGTGRSRPYVDKKDFFQDLKKPLSSGPAPVAPPGTVPAPKRLLKQVTMSQAEGADQYTREWHQILSEDPFGSLHFIPAPEADPFDTQFATTRPSLLSTPAATTLTSTARFTPPSLIVHPNSDAGDPISPSPSVASKYSKIIKINSMPTTVKTTPSSSPCLPRNHLRVVLPANHSDSDSETVSVAPRAVASPDQRRRAPSLSKASHSSGSLRWSPGLTTSPPQIASSHLSSSDDDSSSDDTGDRRRAETVAAIPPQPPPRPPVLRPPPLPPKGQPPPVLQRSILSPSEEIVPFNGNSGGHQTPPLPIPVRKPKQSLSATLSDNQQRRRASQEESVPVSNRLEPASKPMAASSASPNLNQISLMQLSSMSLCELAATLQLPPARLASMTLTELALRLAELNKAAETVSSAVEQSETPPSTHPPQLYYQTAEEDDDEYDEDDEDGDDEEEEREDEDDDEEEGERDESAMPANVNVDETEICYKGGKKYEILSDTAYDPDMECRDSQHHPRTKSSDVSSKSQHAVNITGRDVCPATGSVPAPSAPTCTASSAADGDRYAALREIMEQDLAVSVSTTIPLASELAEDDGQETGFANFADAPRVPASAASLFSESPVASRTDAVTFPSPVFGFEDDFGRYHLGRPEDASSYSGTGGARPKTTLSSKRSGNTSISSGSAEFDAFEDDFTSKGSWNGSIKASEFPPSDSPVRELGEESCGSHQKMVGNGDAHTLDADGEEAIDELAEELVDKFAEKFAAFEARFPLNPVQGFGDSFADFDLGGAVPNATASVSDPSATKKDVFVVDFASAFNGEPLDQFAADTDAGHQQRLHQRLGACSSERSADQKVTKSTSVNIFKRIDNPFDDDFFQPEDVAHGNQFQSTGASKQAPIRPFGAIVEDPFAWVQPFDDNVQFDDDEFTS